MPQPDHYRNHDSEIQVLVFSGKERRALYYLLDRLCEHEEAVGESVSLNGGMWGPVSRNCADDYLELAQAYRVWRTAQWLMELIDPELEDKTITPEMVARIFDSAGAAQREGING